MKNLTSIQAKVVRYIFWVCCFLYGSIAVQAQVSQAERDALIELFTATGGENWINTLDTNSPWRIEDPTSLVATWHGVTVVGGQVVGLDLSSNALTGALPESIGDLIHLQTLVLENNAISGTIPNTLGNLSQLNVLDLGTNTLVGEIPEALGSLLALRSLSLDHNGLTGVLPPALGSLSQLTYMDLSYNAIQGTIPIAFCNLSNLLTLNLSHSQLSGEVPRELGILTQLQNLDLSTNAFTKLPVELSSLSNVRFVAVNDNQLTGALPFNANANTRLETLHFENNKYSFIDFEAKHSSFRNYVNTSYRYFPQQKTDNVESRMVTAGNSITLTTALSSVNNRYQWFKDGLPISGATDKSYTIAAAQASDQGTYTIRITNTLVDQLVLERNAISLEVVDTCLVPASERQALIEIYNETNGFSWVNTLANNQVWQIDDINSSVCDWYGVTVENNTVVALVLPSNNLANVLPDVFASLPGLSILNVYDNNLEGNIPASLTSLTSLETVAVEGNALFHENIAPVFSILQNRLAAFTYIPQANVDSEEVLTAAAGDPVTLFIDYEDGPNVRYQWFKNGLPIPGATSIQFAIPSASATDAGTYFAEITHTVVNGLTLMRNPITVNVGSDCNVSVTERDVLLEFYTATDGSNWQLTNNNWSVDVPVCDWEGVTVENNTVVAIVLDNAGITGTLPATLANLVNLRQLSLIGNNLTGSIPAELWAMPSLERLALESNQFNGELNIPLVTSSSLKSIRIASNLITGTIPSEFVTFRSLDTLSIGKNDFSGEIPAVLGQLTQLKHLDLSSMGLTGTIPDTFAQLVDLEELYLLNNQLEGELPTGLNALTRLQTLSLEGNNFSGAIPLGSITSGTLNRLTVQDNAFVFADLTPVVNHFAADPTRVFTYSPQALVGKTQTKTVALGASFTLESPAFSDENNQYQWYKDGQPIAGATAKTLTIDTVTEGDMGEYELVVTNTVLLNIRMSQNLIAVTTAAAGSCAVSDADRQALIDFYKTTNGDTWSNTISGTQPWLIDDPNSSVCDWYGVTVADDFSVIGIALPNNEVRGEIPSTLAQLTALQILDLSNNQIIGELTSTITSLVELQELYLNNNVLVGAIPEELENLTALQILNLGGNRFSRAIPGTLGALQQLTSLDLSANKLEDEIPEEIWQLANLQSLKLQENRLTGTVSTTIGNVTQLEELWLSENEFSGSIPVSISTITTLRSVRINDNSFSGDLPELISNYNLPNTEIQMQNNAFVFSDFEPEFPTYTAQLSSFQYAPQARVDRSEVITVNLGDDVTLETIDLTSANNTYRWFKDSDFLIETTLREINIDNITEDDLGTYYFMATNSTITGLTLERNRIVLRLPPPDTEVPVGGQVQRFCFAESTPTFADLVSPFSGNTTWYTSEIGGALLDNDTEVSEGTYWAQGTAGEPRLSVIVEVATGTPGIEDEDYQEFAIIDAPTVADLAITGTNISWYTSASGGSPLSSTTTLVDDTTYYAQEGTASCRFAVNVFVGVQVPDGDAWQPFCASEDPTIAILTTRYTALNNHQLVWYRNATGNETIPVNEGLEDDGIYFLAQRDPLNNESERKRVTVSVFTIEPPAIANDTQVFYTNEPVFISNLNAIGNGILWYDAPFGGTAYRPSDVLVDGEVYYAAQTGLNCVQGSSTCCESTLRTQVTVSIQEEVPPSLVGCERFRPQPGARYVISAWVREDGLQAINPVRRNFSDVSSTFVALLNFLVNDKILAEDPKERHISSVFVPKPDTREFDILIPYIQNTTDKNLTVYNFEYIKERQEGVGAEKTIGFSFALSPNANATRFIYKTPKVFLNFPTNYNTYDRELSYHYPLLGNENLSLEFTGVSICGNKLCAVSSFQITAERTPQPITVNLGNNATHQEIVDVDISFRDTRNSTNYTSAALVNSEITTYDFISDPNYQVMSYANSLLKIRYRDADGADIPQETRRIQFEPKGAIINGWQRIYGDFTIPLNAINMIVSLESAIQNNTTAQINVHFDDVRMHPFESNMKSFVYDPLTQRLQSELDENNYATFYEYDQEGGLIRVKKETERGVYTIQETRSNTVKKNN